MCTCRLRTQRHTYLHINIHASEHRNKLTADTLGFVIVLLLFVSLTLVFLFILVNFFCHVTLFLIHFPFAFFFLILFLVSPFIPLYFSFSLFSIHSTVFFSFPHSFFSHCTAMPSFIHYLSCLIHAIVFLYFFLFSFSLFLRISLIPPFFSYFVILPLFIPYSAVFSSLYIFLSLILLHFSHFLILSHSVSLPNRRRGDGGHAASQSSPADGRRALGSCGAPSCIFLHRLLRFHLFFPSFALVPSCLNEEGTGGVMKEEEG